jgi:hypothetical protein
MSVMTQVDTRHGTRKHGHVGIMMYTGAWTREQACPVSYD